MNYVYVDMALDCCDHALRPRRATPGSAGHDLVAADGGELASGQRQLIPTGCRLAVPEGYVGLVMPRSGLALRHGVTVLNAPGVIDPDYRGVVGVLLINLGNETWAYRRGDRIAQLLLVPCSVMQPILVAKEWFVETERGEDGFGSTGVSTCEAVHGGPGCEPAPSHLTAEGLRRVSEKFCVSVHELLLAMTPARSGDVA